ncbi:MAG: hypothetical protein NZ960_08165 [Candidatus Kapabacteria bacterium]|nr:hypothetical protein [Candidatus Kapabacteria bacterium]MDW8012845.1 hypothetical protein [Bacteroidota bacterium]
MSWRLWLLVSSAVVAHSSPQLPILPDTVCLRYRFQPGDTLIYRVEAQDSIFIYGQPPLVRERYETLVLICDSVGADGSFWLRMVPTEFLARERMDTLQSLRPVSPCQHRPVVLQVDTLGTRLSGHAPENTVVCPGGVLQLPFLQPLHGCIRAHESWLVQDSLLLWENATPPPRFARTALLRAFLPRDTLGHRCLEVQFTTTGSGWYIRDSAFAVRAVTNSFGRLLLSTEGIPVWSYTTQEIRLSLQLGGTVTEGLHYINLWHRLEEYQSARRKLSPSPAVPPETPAPTQRRRRSQR